ncbi:hypothetical protein GCM10027430_24690 [Lysobacter tyrosinilyticus]
MLLQQVACLTQYRWQVFAGETESRRQARDCHDAVVHGPLLGVPDDIIPQRVEPPLCGRRIDQPWTIDDTAFAIFEKDLRTVRREQTVLRETEAHAGKMGTSRLIRCAAASEALNR